MLIAHRIALNPNNAQATYFARAAGTERFAFNWALKQWQEQYVVWKADNSLPRPSQQALRRQLNAIKREQYPWMTDLTSRFHTIGIEDLNVRGMMANRHLARAIADMSFHELRRQLEYKAAMRGGQIVVADRWFASSKLCSACGHKLVKLELSVRSWACPHCRTEHDRDLNAALNLRTYAVSSTVSACGGEGAGLGGSAQVKPAPVKQEVSFVSV